jgi:hypothetical protein
MYLKKRSSKFSNGLAQHFATISRMRRRFFATERALRDWSISCFQSESTISAHGGARIAVRWRFGARHVADRGIGINLAIQDAVAAANILANRSPEGVTTSISPPSRSGA